MPPEESQQQTTEKQWPLSPFLSNKGLSPFGVILPPSTKLLLPLSKIFTSLPKSDVPVSMRCFSLFVKMIFVFDFMLKFVCSATRDCSKGVECLPLFKEIRNVACGILAVWAVTAVSPVIAANQIFRCKFCDDISKMVGFLISEMLEGQANGVYDKPLDLRFCDYTNEKTNLKGKSLAAALMSDAKFDGADMSEVVMSKAYAVGASFKGTDFSNAVLDRVNFEKANLQGAVFKNTVLSGSTFNDAQLQDVDFEDTIIGYIDLQKLCVNKTISEEGRANLGCR
ncbi:UNVERIFIED_CONTAM: Thylakoid lumenal protein, chloroplastic [Sesamum angustifolium]|uniref:Thylakoid lumenal protein, chloroplastic n=1 Tax=Sesamum angustifolium TaxID=2727405 RepID=A0AAW2PSZ4_9LAMI